MSSCENLYEFEPLYEYANPPNMPGVRQIARHPEETYRVNAQFDEEKPNFLPSEHPDYNIQRPVPVMAAGGIGMERFGNNNSFLVNLLICILLIYLIIVLVR